MRLLFLLYGFFMLHSFSQEVDTVHVYQSDTLVFSSTGHWIQRPCQKKREFSIKYDLINSQDSTYYYIYNTSNLLVESGLYTATYTLANKTHSGFYNSKFYRYNKRGKLTSIHYQEAGRNTKSEYYKRGRLKETKFWN